MNQEEIRELLHRYADDKCSADEKEQLERLVMEKPLLKEWQWKSEEERILTGLRIKAYIDHKRLPKSQKPTFRLWYAGIAAALLLVAGLGWLFVQNQNASTAPTSSMVKTDLKGIILTLSDGSRVLLENNEGQTLQDAGTSIKKLKNELVYRDEGNQATANNLEKPVMNTIQLPKGENFKLILPDGTKVWLNATSSLSYPVIFSGKERKVVLTGEAYFEVAHNSKKPFKVIADHTEIVVTGTHFNVSAYPDDTTISTTLLEGGVNIWRGKHIHQLKPGFEALTYRNKEEINEQVADIENVLAWRNGYFVFDDQNVREVMKKVARWYDIEVTFKNRNLTKRFGGTFPKSANVDELLKDLESLGKMRFKRNGKEVVVMD